MQEVSGSIPLGSTSLRRAAAETSIRCRYRPSKRVSAKTGCTSVPRGYDLASHHSPRSGGDVDTLSLSTVEARQREDGLYIGPARLRLGKPRGAGRHMKYVYILECVNEPDRHYSGNYR
jgi:hypothetical protein